MSRDTRNSIRIFHKQKDGKEIIKRIYPNPPVDWRSFCYENAYELYVTLYTEVCKYFNVLVPEDLPFNVKFCWDTIRSVPIDSDWSKEVKQKIYDDERYKLYSDMKLESLIVNCADSMFNDAYTYIKLACRHNGNKDIDDGIKNNKLRSKLFINYLFNEMLYTQGANLNYCGCWVLRDGSCVYIDTANHRRFVEEYLGLKEIDIERWWVKISTGIVYTHDSINNEQWKTLAKLSKKYNLREKVIGG